MKGVWLKSTGTTVVASPMPALILLLLLMDSCVGARTSYRVATTMHFPTLPPQGATNSSAIRAAQLANLAQYEVLTAEAAAQGAELIVFPESGTGYLMVPQPEIRDWCEPLPPPGWRATVCNESVLQNSPWPHAQWASCSAQMHGIDIVYNFGYHDVLAGHSYYNANAAVNQFGFVLAVYRKSHINAVPYLTQPAVPDPIVFTSSFGVTFGMEVCYDLWFHEPWETEMTRGNITNYLYPNGMASLAPLETIDQLHAGFSLAHGVTLISSALFPTGGAGVFHAGNVLGINPQLPYAAAASNVIVTDVPLLHAPPRPFGGHTHAEVEAVAQRIRRATPLTPSAELVNVSGTPCFNGSASCAIFTPAPSQSFHLEATFQGPFANVSCSATVTTLSSSQYTWMLAAAQLDMVPASPSTPDANEAAFCVILQCDSPAEGCAFGAPLPSYWISDLTVYEAEVSATFGGGMANASDVLFFPISGFVGAIDDSDSASNADWQFPLRFLPANNTLASRPYSPSGSQAFTVAVTGAEVATQKLFSVGVYVAKKGETWPTRRGP